MNRREFLGTSLTAGAALAAAPLAGGAVKTGEAQNEAATKGGIKKLPIGVFSPAFTGFSLDAMLDKYVSLGAEAAEVGAAGYASSEQCPLDELVADKAKARAWKKKFDDRGIPIMTLSGHGNVLHPDPAKAAAYDKGFRNTILLAEMLDVPTVVGFSGCPGGSPTDKFPAWIVYKWPDEYAEALEWQWKERIIPYWKDLAKFAQDHGVKRIALEMHPNFSVYNPRTLMRLREAVGPVIGANCDLSHLFWQGCNAVEAIRYLAKHGALYHAHMKDTAFFQQNVDRFGVLNFTLTPSDLEASEFFRSVGYGHGVSFWKDVIATYMEVGFDGMLSVENEDPLLSGEVGVTRSLTVLKHAREELLAAHPNPGETRG
jgi:sugar phosphate isomerase/epimerase